MEHYREMARRNGVWNTARHMAKNGIPIDMALWMLVGRAAWRRWMWKIVQ